MNSELLALLEEMKMIRYDLAKEMIQSLDVTSLRSLLEWAGKKDRGRSVRKLKPKVMRLYYGRRNCPNFYEKLLEIHRLQDATRGRNTRERRAAAPDSTTGRRPKRIRSPDVEVWPIAPPTSYPQHPDVRFKPLPFHSVIAELVKPSSLTRQSSPFQLRNQFGFTLTPQQATEVFSSQDVRTGEYGVQVLLRFCLLETTSVQGDCYPPGLIIWVNSTPCNHQTPSKLMGGEPKRAGLPVDITSLLNLDPYTANTIEVNTTPHFDRFVAAAYLVTKKSSEALLQKLPSRVAFYTKGMIQQKLKEEADSEIAMTCLRVSLVCPLGKMRISSPCRALTCEHVQCFDASLYIKMNEKKTTWLCPVCDKSAPYDNLAIDDYFLDILKSPQLPEDCREVQLLGDGSWTPLATTGASYQRLDPAPSTSEAIPNAVALSSDEECAVVEEKIEEKRPRKRMKIKQIKVIDLASSDSEQVEESGSENTSEALLPFKKRKTTIQDVQTGASTASSPSIILLDSDGPPEYESSPAPTPVHTPVQPDDNSSLDDVPLASIAKRFLSLPVIADSRPLVPTVPERSDGIGQSATGIPKTSERNQHEGYTPYSSELIMPSTVSAILREMAQSNTRVPASSVIKPAARRTSDCLLQEVNLLKSPQELRLVMGETAMASVNCIAHISCSDSGAAQGRENASRSGVTPYAGLTPSVDTCRTPPKCAGGLAGDGVSSSNDEEPESSGIGNCFADSLISRRLQSSSITPMSTKDGPLDLSCRSPIDFESGTDDLDCRPSAPDLRLNPLRCLLPPGPSPSRLYGLPSFPDNSAGARSTSIESSRSGSPRFSTIHEDTTSRLENEMVHQYETPLPPSPDPNPPQNPYYRRVGPAILRRPAQRSESTSRESSRSGSPRVPTGRLGIEFVNHYETPSPPSPDSSPPRETYSSPAGPAIRKPAHQPSSTMGRSSHSGSSRVSTHCVDKTRRLEKESVHLSDPPSSRSPDSDPPRNPYYRRECPAILRRSVHRLKEHIKRQSPPKKDGISDKTEFFESLFGPMTPSPPSGSAVSETPSPPEHGMFSIFNRADFVGNPFGSATPSPSLTRTDLADPIFAPSIPSQPSSPESSISPISMHVESFARTETPSFSVTDACYSSRYDRQEFFHNTTDFWGNRFPRGPQLHHSGALPYSIQNILNLDHAYSQTQREKEYDEYVVARSSSSRLTTVLRRTQPSATITMAESSISETMRLGMEEMNEGRPSSSE